MNPRVQDVEPQDGYKLKLTFTNGETGIYDCAPLLDHGIFRELKDPSYFCQVKIEYGTVSWPHEQDLCPDSLYLESEKLPSAQGAH